jgi:hypothetical protein
MYQLRSKVMTSDQKNGTALDHNPGTPYPPPPRFDEAMIAAAQPVEPLVTNQTLSGRQTTVRRSLKNKLILIAAVLIATFLSAAFGGILFRLRGVESRAPDSAEAAPVANQTAEETTRAAMPSANVKVNENLPRKPRRQLSVAPGATDLTLPEVRLNDKPTARKVGVIFFGAGKEARKSQIGWRRRGYNDDDH